MSEAIGAILAVGCTAWIVLRQRAFVRSLYKPEPIIAPLPMEDWSDFVVHGDDIKGLV